MPKKNTVWALLLASTLMLAPSTSLAKDKTSSTPTPSPRNAAGNSNSNSGVASTLTSTPTPSPSPRNGNGNGNGNSNNGITPTPTSSPDFSGVKLCAIGDIQAASACSGYFVGNLNGGGFDKISESKAALSLLGFKWDGMNVVQKIEEFTGQSIAFSTSLAGTSFVSIHYGAGEGPIKAQGGVTGFYKIDTTTPLERLATQFGSLSNAILYSNNNSLSVLGSGGGNGGNVGGVPEPATWLQLIVGFGLIGLAQRRLKRASVTIV